MHGKYRLLAGALLVGVLLGLTSTPAAAATPATLAATIAVLPQPPQPGKAVTYTVTIRNVGTVRAARVQLELTTDAALTGVSYRTSAGRCYRGDVETACLLGTLAPNASVTAKISGRLPAAAPLHQPVTVTATLASDTPLAGSPIVKLVYPLGGPVTLPPRPSAQAAAAAPAPAHGRSAVDLLQPTALTRGLAIGFAVLVVGTLLLAKRVQRRAGARQVRAQPGSGAGGS